MAIRLEHTCDDKGQWPVGAACSLYPNAGQEHHRLPINISQDVEYVDCDDHQTNSCSPDSIDSPVRSKPHFSSLTHCFGPLFSTNSQKNNVFVHDSHSHQSGWSFATDFLQKEPIPQQIKRSRTITNFETFGHNSGYQPRDQLCRRNSSATESVASKSIVKNCDEPQFAKPSTVNKRVLKQNGVSLCDKLRLECDDKNLNSKPSISCNNVFTARKVQTTTAKQIGPGLITANVSGFKGDGFGETDAAEALLGLSEGFFQSKNTVGNQKSKLGNVSVGLGNHSYTKKLSKEAADNCDDDVLSKKNQEHQRDKVDVSKPNSPKHSRFHFKKLICQKFVNSFQPTADATPSAENVTSAKETNSQITTAKLQLPIKSHPTPEMTISTSTSKSHHCYQSSSNDVLAKLVSTPKEVARTTTDISSKSGTHESPQTTSKVSNHCKRDADNQNEVYDCNNTRSMIQLASTKVSEKESRKRDLENFSGKTDLISNLYRISTSLGSSNESLDEISEENDNNIASESSSDSSESESEAEPDCNFSAGQDQSTMRKTSCAFDTSQRKSFVLNKPRFSLPALDIPNRNTSNDSNSVLKTSSLKMAHSFGKEYNKSVENKKITSNLKSPLHKVHGLFGSTSEPSCDLSKQSGIHIKKATFTFSGTGKVDKLERQSGLSMTSPAAVPVEKAHCDVKNKISFRFDRDKLNRNEASPIRKSESNSNQHIAFGTFRNGDSFEKLSKPTTMQSNSEKAKQRQNACDIKTRSENVKCLPYDKHRLPRPSARSAELEAQQKQVLKSKGGRKRKLSSVYNNSKENLSLSEKPLIKRSKHACEITKKTKARHNKKTNSTLSAKGDKETTNDCQQNGDPSIETDIASGTLPRSSSRRKPSRVFKHQKYTSVSMMSSNQNPRDLISSPEFAINSKPLNLDRRVLLANSIDLFRGSSDNLPVDSVASSLMTSSPCSSSTSSVAGDDNDDDLANKTDTLSVEKPKDPCKRHRNLSANETHKSDLMRRKHKLKRLLSVSEQNAHKASVRLLGASSIGNKWPRGPIRNSDRPVFQLLSLFPAPASLRAGFANGELLPGYGPSVSGHRSSLPLRWRKGNDVRELKQKRQREKWRNMSLDMFCMGANT